jgi:hypothetical protein
VHKVLRFCPDTLGKSGPEGQFRRVINTARLNNTVPAVVGLFMSYRRGVG